MKREEKEELAGLFGDIFKSAQIGFLVDYRGMDVQNVNDLRRALHDSATRMRVLKNRVAKIAITGTPFEQLKEHLNEPRALIYGEDPVAPAKVVNKFQTENDNFDLIAGLLVSGGKIDLLDSQRVKALATLPSREELLTQLLYIMQAPVENFVRTLNEIPASFVRTLAALQQEKSEQASEPV